MWSDLFEIIFWHCCPVPTVLGILNSPFSSYLGKPPGYLPESVNITADLLEKFPSMARMANRLDSSSFLDSRSSSPEDSETSGFSSGSDHLCDMLVIRLPHKWILSVPVCYVFVSIFETWGSSMSFKKIFLSTQLLSQEAS